MGFGQAYTIELCKRQAYTIELCKNIIKKLINDPNKEHEWNKYEIEIINEVLDVNNLKKWFERRLTISNYLHQECSNEEYMTKMINWETNNPKPIIKIKE